MILSKQYREFIQALSWNFALVGRPKIAERVELAILMTIPNRMDSDALLKPLFDALQHAEVIVNDNQIKKYSVEVVGINKNPRIDIEVRYDM
jgi:Holliday junction resolvase RusA-like endonuclease